MRNKIHAIYAIRHIPSGRNYVGSAVDVHGRWRCHRSSLRRNIHSSRYLQNAWNKFGEDVFAWLILEIVAEPRNLVAAEQLWIDKLAACKRRTGFNISPTAGSSLGRNVKASTRAKHRAAMRGNAFTKGKKLTEEHRAKIKAASKHLPCPEHQKEIVRSKLSQWWKVTTPDGDCVLIKNLRAFCRERCVALTSLYWLAVGRVTRNRLGWQCSRAAPPGWLFDIGQDESF